MSFFFFGTPCIFISNITFHIDRRAAEDHLHKPNHRHQRCRLTLNSLDDDRPELSPMSRERADDGG